MFGSEILDVALGLTLVYLLLSLLATAVREGVESIIRARAVFLERGIRELLGDPDGSGLARRFYEHPLIYSLFRGEYTPRARRRLGRLMPNYIPSRNFAVALLDLARQGEVRTPEGEVLLPYAAARTEPIVSLAELRAAAQRLGNPYVERALLSAIDEAHGDLTAVQKNLEAWFDSAMDRVSGWYKRRTQGWLFVIAVGMAILLNVDSVTITNHLWHDKAAREALARRAELVAGDSDYRRLIRDTTPAAPHLRERYEAFESLDSIDIPVGWHRKVVREHAGLGFWASLILGWLITALAISLGAPFWFDVLNRIMVIRSTVKPHEKSPEESSEDRQKPPASAVDRGAPRPEPVGIQPDLVGQFAAPLPAVEPPFTARQWANGDPEEGLL